MAGRVIQKSVDCLIAKMEEVEKMQGEFNNIPCQTCKNTAMYIHFGLDNIETFLQLEFSKDTIQTTPEREMQLITPSKRSLQKRYVHGHEHYHL
jgi:hypothetical protein